ncbi:MAG: signal peptide peptidase SppA, partial [Elusimicrobiaceae bacterium]|nr:signal peptide peptidase SppA [Elusimicrobiaceae bacterium]
PKSEKKEESSGVVSSFSKSSKPGIAWIKIRGVIAQDNNTSPFSRPTGAGAVAKRIRTAAEDKNVKAIVLDINSPGGTVASVQNIYSEVLNAKEKGKKVVALMRDVAASGGFYVAMAADKIVAEPGTITGSVGVIMQTSNVEGLFDKIGVKMIPITSGRYKDMGSAFRPMTDAEKAILQDMVNDTYTQFFAAVKAGRPNVKQKDLTEYTDGRVFTGQRAFNLGFIDKLGGEEEARLLAGELAGLKDPKVLQPRREGIREFIFSLGSGVESQTLAKQLQTLATPSVSYLWVN